MDSWICCDKCDKWRLLSKESYDIASEKDDFYCHWLDGCKCADPADDLPDHTVHWSRLGGRILKELVQKARAEAKAKAKAVKAKAKAAATKGGGKASKSVSSKGVVKGGSSVNKGFEDGPSPPPPPPVNRRYLRCAYGEGLAKEILEQKNRLTEKQMERWACFKVLQYYDRYLQVVEGNDEGLEALEPIDRDVERLKRLQVDFGPLFTEVYRLVGEYWNSMVDEYENVILRMFEVVSSQLYPKTGMTPEVLSPATVNSPLGLVSGRRSSLLGRTPSPKRNLLHQSSMAPNLRDLLLRQTVCSPGFLAARVILQQKCVQILDSCNEFLEESGLAEDDGFRPRWHLTQVPLRQIQGGEDKDVVVACLYLRLGYTAPCTS